MLSSCLQVGRRFGRQVLQVWVTQQRPACRDADEADALLVGRLATVDQLALQ
jgi:hypothetical protein